MKPASVASAAAAPALVLPPLGRREEGLSTVQRRAVVGAIAGLHVAAVWGLLQVREVREAVAEAAPLFVSLIAPEKPKPIVPPPPPPPPPKTVPPKREPPPILAAPPTPQAAPATFTVPPPPPEPAPAVAPAVVAEAPPAPPAPAPAPPAPAPAPPVLPSSAVQYLRPPSVTYPAMSRRLNEGGRVLVRVWIDEAGQPQKVSVHKGSGHARLDAAAVAAVEKALFIPYVHQGRTVGAWTFVPIDFDLE